MTDIITMGIITIWMDWAGDWASDWGWAGVSAQVGAGAGVGVQAGGGTPVGVGVPDGVGAQVGEAPVSTIITLLAPTAALEATIFMEGLLQEWSVLRYWHHPHC